MDSRPWVMDEENQGEWGVNYSIQMANNRLVDVAEMVGTKEDAHLIAAAPDLYEALFDLFSSVDCPAHLTSVVDAALAKARGEA